MLIVEIKVNERVIERFNVIRVAGDTNPNSINSYDMEGEARPIKHRYGDGAIVLAQKMLRRVQRKRGRSLPQSR